MKKLMKGVFSLLLVLTFITGCGTKVEKTEYPYTYKDSFGNEVVIESEINKIVSLSPNITELLYSLELGDKIVGRTDYCDYPEEATKKESVGSLMEPSLEKIVALEPDVVITDGMQNQTVLDSIRNSGIKVLIVRNNVSIEGTYEIIETLGKLTNTNDKAAKLIESMKKDIKKLQEAVKDIKDEDKKKVYYSIDMGEYGLYTAGKDTYINSLLEAAGLVNVATDLDGWTYSLEKLIEHDPDYIILSNQWDAKKNALNYEPVKDLTAIKNEAIIEVDTNLFDRQTIRNVKAIKTLIKEIYGKEVKIINE